MIPIANPFNTNYTEHGAHNTERFLNLKPFKLQTLQTRNAPQL